MSRVPVFPSAEAALAAARARAPRWPSHNSLAMYSSALGGITTDPAMMVPLRSCGAPLRCTAPRTTAPAATPRARSPQSNPTPGLAPQVVPLDDHLVHRGHCVFDTANVHAGRTYGLDFHLDRLFKSAQLARIERLPPRQEIKDAILATIAAAGERDGVYARYWLSAGRGDFFVSPRGLRDHGAVGSEEGRASFYAVVHRGGGKGLAEEGVAEATVGVPLKTKLLGARGPLRANFLPRPPARITRSSPPPSTTLRSQHQEQQLPAECAHRDGGRGQGRLPRRAARRARLPGRVVDRVDRSRHCRRRAQVAPLRPRARLDDAAAQIGRAHV